VLHEAITEAGRLGDRRTEALARLQLSRVRAQTDPEWLFREARDEAMGMAATFAEEGDHAAAIRAWYWVGLADFWNNECAEAERAYDRMVEHATWAGDERQMNRVPWWVFAAITLGPRPVADADELVQALVDRGRADPYIPAFGNCMRGVLIAMRGDFDQARSLRDRAREMIDELGMPLHRAGISMMLGLVDELAGDLQAAEDEYRTGYDLCRALGDTGYLSTTACCLGRVALAQGRYEEALRLSEESEVVGAADDLLTQLAWRALRARVFARQGRLDEAETLAREAKELASRGDTIDERARALSALSEVLQHAGKADEARSFLEEALRLWEQKGNVALASPARNRLMELERQ
jgi:tetratricopeptide (TPR) repeat protein